MSVDSRIASTLQRKTRVRGWDQRLFVWSLPSAVQGTGYWSSYRTYRSWFPGYQQGTCRARRQTIRSFLAAINKICALTLPNTGSQVFYKSLYFVVTSIPRFSISNQTKWLQQTTRKRDYSVKRIRIAHGGLIGGLKNNKHKTINIKQLVIQPVSFRVRAPNSYKRTSTEVRFSFQDATI